MAAAPDLLDRRISVGVELHGFPGLMTVPASWDTGSVTIREHMVYFVRRGRIRVNEHLLSAGGCALVPPGTAFRARSVDGAAAIMRCRLDVSRNGRVVPGIPQVMIRQRAWEIEPVVGMLIDAAGNDATDHAATDHAAGRDVLVRDDRARCLAVLLIAGLGQGGGESVGLDARQRRALADLVARHRAHGLTPRDLAAHLTLTLDYFTRRFRQTYGMAPRRWLVAERIRVACALLAEGGASLEQVAGELGYDDLKLFGRQFRQVMGMPPGRWRSRSG
jgi:AraC-like DNA-binding protein